MNNKNLGGRVNRRKLYTLIFIPLLKLAILAAGCGGGKMETTTHLPTVTPSSHLAPESPAGSDPTSELAPVTPPIPSVAEPDKPEGEYWAVVVGIGEYAHLDGDTGPNDDDAKALHETLSHLWGEDHVKLLVDGDATKADIRTAITRWLAPREEAGDTVVYFFAGHSLTDERYMLPYDCDSRPTSISGDELDGWLDTLDSKRVVVVLETCEAGKFTGDLAEPGRVILMSSEEDEASHGSDDGFVFPHYLMEALTSLEETDFNGDDQVSAEEIFEYVAPKVTCLLARYDIPQHPQLFDGCEGEVVLMTLK